VREIAGRNTSRKAPLRPEELHRRAFQHSRVVKLVLDRDDGRILEANAAACRFYGHERETLLKMALADLDTRPAAELSEALARPAAGRNESVRHRAASGAVREVELHWDALELDGRALLSCVVHEAAERRGGQTRGGERGLHEALYRIAQTSNSFEDMASFYAAIHAIMGELMYARNFYIALRDDASGDLRFPYFVDEHDTLPPVIREGRRTLTAYVLRTGEPLLATAAVCAELEARGEIESVGQPSVDWLGVPLKRGDDSFGAIVVQTYQPSIRYGAADREILTFVSEHVAAAIDRKRAADALRESEARFRTLAETAPVAIFIYQAESFRYANPALAVMSGYSRDELRSTSFWDMIHPDSRARIVERGLLQSVAALPPGCELRIVRKDGSERWAEFSVGSIEVDGQPAALGTAFDVTERKRAEEQIKSLAYVDSLTGLPNRLLFNDRVTMAVAHAHRHGHRLAVIFLDLDRFKTINDSLGHSLGDRLLQGVAERLQGSVREGDTVARLGGDEFILLLPEITRGLDVVNVAEKIREALRHPFRLEGRELFATASMGVSLYPDDGIDAETLVKNADVAMYRAKEHGRDNYRLYAPAMNATALERLALESSLRKALGRGELVVYYQPLVDLRFGRIHGVEALLRWRHPEKGLLAPSEFIPLAELTGLILGIGSWVLRTACAQVKSWQARGHRELSVAVNISARQFGRPDLVETVKRALRETGLEPRFLDLEITESNAMQNAENTIHTLNELKAIGVRISIDDFGIGYSSLSYLKRLPIDTLKIDQSFVRDITVDPDDAAIATAVIAMAHTLKLKVVAEGVETEGQGVFLAARHCDRMQGYLFSAPLPAEDVEAFLGGDRWNA
jgi:diguanylate cyclase (GGDEF)-like protein/PAS domain S-box-containing protein